MDHYDCKHCGTFGCFSNCLEGQAEKARLLKQHKLEDEINSLRDGYGDICVEDLSNDFKLIEEGKWSQDHKYQFSSSVVQHIKTNTFWMIKRSRSCSYHSDWYYDNASFKRVTPVVRTKQVTSWKEVK